MTLALIEVNEISANRILFYIESLIHLVKLYEFNQPCNIIDYMCHRGYGMIYEVDVVFDQIICF